MFELFETFFASFRKLDEDPNIKPIHGFRVWLLTLILLGAFLGLTTPIFVWLNVPTFTGAEIVVSEFQENIRNQGIHFLSGVILGYMFTHPATGLTFGILREFIDVLGFIRHSQLTYENLVDSFIDLTFWAGGGLVGFYLLANVQYLLYKNNIRGLKDLTTFVMKRVRNRNGKGV